MDDDRSDPVDQAALSGEMDAWLCGVAAGLVGSAAWRGRRRSPADQPGFRQSRFRHFALRPAPRQCAAAAGQGRSGRTRHAALGHAQADAVRASTEAPQDGSAYRAVAAVKKLETSRKLKTSSITMT
ncbi:MAG TPA: hypothetical protein VGM32_17415 [Rhodopila sp.]